MATAEQVGTHFKTKEGSRKEQQEYQFALLISNWWMWRCVGLIFDHQ